MVEHIDTIDRKMLYELHKNARITETALAKKVGRSKESVRYRMRKLQEKGIIIGYRAWFDPSKLGFTSAKIYLTLANNPERVDAFKAHLKTEKRLFWFGIAHGAWNAGLTFYINNSREFFDLKNNIYTQFKDIILDNRTGFLTSVHVGDLSFLTGMESQWMTFFDSTTKPVELDKADKEILKRLYNNAREHIVTIAEHVHLSPETVRQRIKRLEREGVISRYRATIDYNKLGYEFFKTFLYFTNLTPEEEMRLMEYSRVHPHILHLMKQISAWDVELEIMAENYLHYNQILDELTREFSSIITKTETAIMGEDYVYPAKHILLE
jgi:Lrp/AsnC family transcriptional regulator, leucine-responsive regulatory protein